jgi:hypothetical protein
MHPSKEIEAIALEILETHPSAEVVYVADDGMPFLEKQYESARQYAQSEGKELHTFNRESAADVADAPKETPEGEQPEGDADEVAGGRLSEEDALQAKAAGEALPTTTDKDAPAKGSKKK